MCTLWWLGVSCAADAKELALELEERGYDWAREEEGEMAVN